MHVKRFGRPLVVFLALGCVAACEEAKGGGGEPKSIAKSYYALEEAGGDFVLYSGLNIASLMSNGYRPGDNDPNPYFALRVPAALVEKAKASKEGVASFSLEDAGLASSIEAIVNHFPEPGKPTTVRAKPGDAWVTGIGQVAISKDGDPIGLFQMIVWKKYENGPMTSDTFTTGLYPDPEMPTPRYVGDPASWPEKPSHWQ